MSESLVEIRGMILMGQNKALGPAFCRGSDPGLTFEIYVSFSFPWNISVALITYLKLKHDTFRGNIKVLLGHLDWGLGTKGPQSDPVDKSFLGLHIVSNVSKWSNLLLKMGWKFLSLAPVRCSYVYFSIKTFFTLPNDQSFLTFIKAVDINSILVVWLFFECEQPRMVSLNLI